MSTTTEIPPQTFRLTLRTLFLVGFFIAMPVLALPQVARQVDRWIYGKLNSTVPQVQSKRDVSPAEIPHSQRSTRESSPLSRLAPPAPLPKPAGGEIAPVSFPAPDTAPSEVEISPQDLAHLEQIRTQLVRLGAQEVRLEQFPGVATSQPAFAFYCRMFVAEGSSETHPFAAVETNPIMAAEKVLKEIRAWRLEATMQSDSGKNLVVPVTKPSKSGRPTRSAPGS